MYVYIYVVVAYAGKRHVIHTEYDSIMMEAGITRRSRAGQSIFQISGFHQHAYTYIYIYICTP